MEIKYQYKCPICSYSIEFTNEEKRTLSRGLPSFIYCGNCLNKNNEYIKAYLATAGDN